MRIIQKECHRNRLFGQVMNTLYLHGSNMLDREENSCSLKGVLESR